LRAKLAIVLAVVVPTARGEDEGPTTPNGPWAAARTVRAAPMSLACA